MSAALAFRDPSSIVHVARQAILDARGHVAGYELLYRGGVRDTTCTVDGDIAGTRVLTGAVLDLRLDTLTNGRTAFINVTRSMLLNGVATLLQPSAAVFELSEDISVDDDVIGACRCLSASGYRLALDDFLPGSPAEALLPYVSYAKVDARASTRQDIAALARWLTPSGVVLVAENVQTRDVFDTTRAAGCTLFQGRYFHRPEIRSGGALPVRHAVHLRLLAALNRPTLTIDSLEDLVKQDATLSLRVLQCINSAAFPIRREVRSISEALVMLGVSPIRKWASVWCLAHLNTGGSSELATMALLRARSCELLGETLPDVGAGELFLVGLCSVLDAMMGCSMAEAIADLPLSGEARSALLGEPSPLGSLLAAVIAYEEGSWERAVDAAEALGAAEASLPHAYSGALAWAHEFSASGLGG